VAPEVSLSHATETEIYCKKNTPQSNPRVQAYLLGGVGVFLSVFQPKNEHANKHVLSMMHRILGKKGVGAIG
jgi:hypothetical protein